MATVFSHATQALTEDHGHGSQWVLLVAMVLLGVWGAWCCLARLTVYAVTDTARLEVERAVHPLETAVDGRVVATYLALGREVQSGEALVELEAEPQRLQREEERTRLATLTQQLTTLRVEVATAAQALTEAQQAARLALDEAGAQFQEALARAQFATEEATRSTRLHARGFLAELDILRVQAEAQRRQAAATGLRLAMARLQREQQTRDGRVRVELAVDSESAARLPLQHGLRGTVEVEVEQAAPVTLVLRAAGQLLATPRTWLAARDRHKEEP